MRMKRPETIAYYRDKFLEGKSEEYKNNFDQKNIDQQYAAIMNWKRSAKNLGNATGDLAKVTISNVISHLKNAHKTLANLATLSPRESAKLQELIDSFRGTIDNFDRVKKEQLIAELQTQKEKLQKDSDSLSRKIEELQQQLAQ